MLVSGFRVSVNESNPPEKQFDGFGKNDVIPDV